MMEVLSHKIMTEEPTACSLIAQALNRGHQMALRTTEISALAVLTAHVSTMAETSTSHEVAFETVKQKVRNELDTFVDDADFLSLFEFVVELGGRSSGFLAQLVDFAAKFVNPKLRQLRLVAFAEANKLPRTCPRCKIAIIMRAYRKNPTRGWCPVPEVALTKHDDSVYEKMEAILHYFHVKC